MKFKLQIFLFQLCIVLIMAQGATAATIVYQNDFENPSSTPYDGTYKDLSQQTVNFLYGSEFSQTNTVETILINGGYDLYSDPTSTGGSYAIGMLSQVQNDKLALAINIQGKDYVNLAIDLAGIALQTKAGTTQFLTGAPTLSFELFDTTENAPIFTGVSLDYETITGKGDTSHPFIFDWTHSVIGLDASGAAGNWVSLVFDLTAGGYASFDNLIVAVSDTEGDIDPVPEPATLILLGSGLAGLAFYRRKRK